MMKGRLSLVPMHGSQSVSETRRGSPIVILHRCIVPVVLDCVDEDRQEYRVLGEAFAEDIMHGEAVDWEQDEAEDFTLV